MILIDKLSIFRIVVHETSDAGDDSTNEDRDEHEPRDTGVESVSHRLRVSKDNRVGFKEEVLQPSSSSQCSHRSKTGRGGLPSIHK